MVVVQSMLKPVFLLALTEPQILLTIQQLMALMVVVQSVQLTMFLLDSMEQPTSLAIQ